MKYVIGVDLGGTFIKSAIFTQDGEIVVQSSVDTGDDHRPEVVVKRIADAVNANINEKNINKSHISGLGIGSPGPLNSKTGIVKFSPNIKGWRDVPLRDLLEKETGIKTKLYNDANAAAYGEFWKGAGKDVSTFVMFTLGTGIGGGLILNNKLYTGIDDYAGELGHMTVLPDGPLCGCGNYGCIEALASATAVVRRTIEGIEKGRETILKKDLAEGTLTCKAVYNAAVAGDKYAIEILAETGRYLGIVASWMVNALNPEMIVYSGGLSKAGPYLFDHIISEAKKRSLAAPFERVKICPAQLGYDAGLIGAAGLLLAED